jgi:hypothetical protein
VSATRLIGTGFITLPVSDRAPKSSVGDLHRPTFADDDERHSEASHGLTDLSKHMRLHTIAPSQITLPRASHLRSTCFRTETNH